jgi:hypothetical protein
MPPRKYAKKSVSKKTRSRKPGKFKRILKYTGIGLITATAGYGAWHFLRYAFPSVAAGIKSGALTVFSSPASLYNYAQAHGFLSITTALGVGAGVFAGARTALWAGKKMHLSDKATKRIRNVSMVVGGLVGAAHPVVTTLLAIVCYKDNRFTLYRWVKGAWKWLKPKLKAGWEKLKPHLKAGLKAGWEKTRDGARAGVASARDKLAERRGAKRVDAQQPVVIKGAVVESEAAPKTSPRLAEVNNQIRKLEERFYLGVGEQLSDTEKEELQRLRTERNSLEKE